MSLTDNQKENLINLLLEEIIPKLKEIGAIEKDVNISKDFVDNLAKSLSNLDLNNIRDPSFSKNLASLVATAINLKNNPAYNMFNFTFDFASPSNSELNQSPQLILRLEPPSPKNVPELVDSKPDVPTPKKGPGQPLEVVMDDGGNVLISTGKLGKPIPFSALIESPQVEPIELIIKDWLKSEGLMLRTPFQKTPNPHGN